MPTASALDRALEATIVASWTRIGFELRRRCARWAPVSAHRLAGATVVMTGATSGLGLAASTAMARAGADVLMVGRDPARLEHARSAVQAEARGSTVAAAGADLSDLSSVRRLAAELRRSRTQVDLLIHNAGALLPCYSLTADGLEATLATHVLGPFVLTQELLPLLGRSASPRVITVSSGGMYTQRLDVENLVMTPATYRGATAYARRGLLRCGARPWPGQGAERSDANPDFGP